MNEPIAAELEQEVVDTVQLKFDEQEQYFQKTLQCHATLRAFFEKHREAISPFHWRAYGWCDTEIVFNHYSDSGKEKEIARAFGKDGWKRVADRFACGAIKWVKELDGCQLIIENAESLKPSLIETVKL